MFYLFVFCARSLKTALGRSNFLSQKFLWEIKKVFGLLAINPSSYNHICLNRVKKILGTQHNVLDNFHECFLKKLTLKNLI
jgi:hypothetical protein